MGNCLCGESKPIPNSKPRSKPPSPPLRQPQTFPRITNYHKTALEFGPRMWRLPDGGIRVETVCEMDARHRQEQNGGAQMWKLPNGGIRVETVCEMKARHNRERGGRPLPRRARR